MAKMPGLAGFASERLAGMPIHVFETFSGVDAIWHRQECYAGEVVIKSLMWGSVIVLGVFA